VSETCGETMEIVIPHFDPHLDTAPVKFTCARRAGHRPPHTPHAGAAARYDREDAESMTLAEVVFRAEVEAVKSRG
jgi:hypothetical protein